MDLQLLRPYLNVDLFASKLGFFVSFFCLLRVTLIESSTFIKSLWKTQGRGKTFSWI